MTDYEAIDAINQSSLKNILTSPLAYRYWLEHPRPDTPSLALGRAIHCAVLEPDTLLEWYTRNPHSGTTKDGKEFKAEAEERGLVVLNFREWDTMVRAAEAVRSHAACAHTLSRLTSTELELTWMLDGRRCKGRIDGTGPGLLVELKTCRRLSTFPQDCARYHYPFQLAWYYDGLASAGYPVTEVRLLVVETEPPYDAACYVVPDDVLELGRDEYRRALELLARCEESGHWPGAHEGTELLVLPQWAYGPEDTEDAISGLEFDDV